MTQRWLAIFFKLLTCNVPLLWSTLQIFKYFFWSDFFLFFFMYSISSNEIAGTNTHDRIALDKHLMFDKKKDAILLILTKRIQHSSWGYHFSAYRCTVYYLYQTHMHRALNIFKKCAHNIGRSGAEKC